MKVAIVTPNLNYGGAERVAVNLSNELINFNDVSIILLKDSGPLQSAVKQPVNLVNLKSRSTLNAIIPLKSHLEDNDYDLVISVLTEANLICCYIKRMYKHLNFKLITRIANTVDQIEEKTFVSSFLYKILIKRLYKYADLIVANSQSTLDGFCNLNLINIDQSKVIYNPVYTSKYEFRERKGRPLIITVGRLVPQKNFLFFIEVANYLVNEKRKNFHFMIFGEGPLKESIERKIERYNLNEHVKLHEPTNQIFDYYERASVFLMTSVYEGFGNVIVEAMSRGVHCIVPNCPGGPAEIVGNENGMIYHDYNASTVGEMVICKIQNNPEASLKYIERSSDFSPDKIAKEYIDAAFN